MGCSIVPKIECYAIPFILGARLVDAPAGVTQEEGHTGLIHLPIANAKIRDGVLCFIIPQRECFCSISTECIALQHIDLAGELVSYTVPTASHMNMLRLGPNGYNTIV